MSLRRHVRQLAADERWSYSAAGASAAEPAAWAALALIAHGEIDAASRPAQWLAELQQSSGAVGVDPTQDEPRWPTSLSMLAWCAWDDAAHQSRFARCTEKAARWSLAARGTTSPRSPMIGHDTTLIGWSWAEATHSWLEPTCFFVMGLRAAGYGDHARTIEGARLVLDRLLPSGGANYGNTIALGQELLPHVQPTGLALWALAGQNIDDRRIERSLEYLEQAAEPGCAPASLAFACLGLHAHGRRPADAASWCERHLDGEAEPPLSSYERSLLLLAAQPDMGWLPAGARGALAAVESAAAVV